jgi:hypothetical protein
MPRPRACPFSKQGRKGSLFDKTNHMNKRQAAKVKSIEREVERMKKALEPVINFS